MTRALVLAAAMSLAISATALAAGGGGSGTDVQTNKHPPAAPSGAAPRMMRSAHRATPANADNSADQLNAKELTSVQATKP
jgi:hypothetical protein